MRRFTLIFTLCFLNSLQAMQNTATERQENSANHGKEQISDERLLQADFLPADYQPNEDLEMQMQVANQGSEGYSGNMYQDMMDSRSNGVTQGSDGRWQLRLPRNGIPDNAQDDRSQQAERSRQVRGSGKKQVERNRGRGSRRAVEDVYRPAVAGSPSRQNSTGAQQGLVEKIRPEPAPFVFDADEWNQRGASFFAQNCSASSAAKRLIQAGLTPQALKNALKFFDNNPSRIFNKSVMAIVDFTKPNTARRMFLIFANCNFETHYVAHGSGKNNSVVLNGVPNKFGNGWESELTPPGFHITLGGIYQGPGRPNSLRMRGLEPWRNGLTEKRGVIIHGTRKYVNADTGSVGRSDGCLTVDDKVSKRIATALVGGALVYNFTPQDKKTS